MCRQQLMRHLPGNIHPVNACLLINGFLASTQLLLFGSIQLHWEGEVAEQTARTWGTQLSRKFSCLQRQRMKSVSKDEQESRAPHWHATEGSVAPKCLFPNVPVFCVYGPDPELGKEAGCSSYPALRAKLALHPKPGVPRVRF